jgi:hypothetical protein
MTPKPRVLWIEDSARFELRNLVGPLFFSGKYDFNIAEDVSTAMHFLRIKEFDALIVDIRLPPGIDATWQDHYRQSNADKVHAQLGLKLLRWLLSKDPSIYQEAPPAWISPQRIGVFTVESPHEIESHLKALGIAVYQQKSAGIPDTILLDLIERLIQPPQASM